MVGDGGHGLGFWTQSGMEDMPLQDQDPFAQPLLRKPTGRRPCLLSASEATVSSST